MPCCTNFCNNILLSVLSQVESAVMADNEDSLVAGRERRNNAGARMSRLLDAEDDDEFYKTTYGGFTEVGADY